MKLQRWRVFLLDYGRVNSNMESRDLATISKARQMLAECKDLLQVRSIRDKAEAVRKYRQAEKDGFSVLIPYAEMVGVELVPTNRHWFMQKFFGDFLAKNKSGRWWFVECKIEERHTGNLFIELWSNRSRRTPGWLDTCQADWLWYYFLDCDALYCMWMKGLREWVTPKELKLVAQGKYDQRNDTWGFLAPIEIMEGEPWFHGPKNPKREVDQRRQLANPSRSMATDSPEGHAVRPAPVD